MNGSSGKEPFSVAPRPEDGSGLPDFLQHLAVCSTANCLCREQANTNNGLRFHDSARLLEPIDNQIGLRLYAPFVERKKIIYVPISEFAPQELSA